jgi:hypothetical protein
MPAEPIPKPQFKHLADIVFLLDLNGSDQRFLRVQKAAVCELLARMCGELRDAFGDSLRYKVCGFGDQVVHPEHWWVENPFAKDVATVLQQLYAPDLVARDNGGAPSSLLDACFKLSKMELEDGEGSENPTRWRGASNFSLRRGSSKRSIIFVTDSLFRTPMTIPGAVGCGVGELLTAIMEKRITLIGLCPEWEGYYDLAAVDHAEFEFLTRASDDTPAHCAAINKLLNEQTLFDGILKGLGKITTAHPDLPLL